MYYMF